MCQTFDPMKKTCLYTDGSNLYIAAYVLTQETGDVDEKREYLQHLIRCNSMSSKPEWAGYAPLEVELLSLQWACNDAQY